MWLLKIPVELILSEEKTGCLISLPIHTEPAFADLDNDGDLDYVINNLDDEAFILRNNIVEKGKKKGPII